MTSILDLCDGLPIQQLSEGEVLLNEGDQTGRLFFLVEGCFEILKGDYQINTVSEPGSIFGEISVLLDVPHMATVKSTTKSSVFRADDADAYLKTHPELNYHLSKLLAQRLQGVTSYLIDLKKQFEDQDGHLGMVDQVLETLVHQQAEEFTPGSDRDSYDNT